MMVLLFGPTTAWDGLSLAVAGEEGGSKEEATDQEASSGPTDRSEPKRTPVDGADLVTLLPLDAIPAIDEPEFVAASEAGGFLRDSDPVLGIEWKGKAKAYGLWFLNGHEIVNDRIGDQPIATTW